MLIALAIRLPYRVLPTWGPTAWECRDAAGPAQTFGSIVRFACRSAQGLRHRHFQPRDRYPTPLESRRRRASAAKTGARPGAGLHGSLSQYPLTRGLPAYADRGSRHAQMGCSPRMQRHAFRTRERRRVPPTVLASDTEPDRTPDRRGRLDDGLPSDPA